MDNHFYLPGCTRTLIVVAGRRRCGGAIHGGNYGFGAPSLFNAIRVLVRITGARTAFRWYFSFCGLASARYLTALDDSAGAAGGPADP